MLPYFLCGDGSTSQKGGGYSRDSLGFFFCRSQPRSRSVSSSSVVVLSTNLELTFGLFSEWYCRNILNIGFIRLCHETKYMEAFFIGVTAGMLI